MKPNDDRTCCWGLGWSHATVVPRSYFVAIPSQIPCSESLEEILDIPIQVAVVQLVHRVLPILYDRPMVHTRERERVIQVGSDITSLQKYWAQIPLVFIHCCGCLRPAYETQWRSKQLTGSWLISCEVFLYREGSSAENLSLHRGKLAFVEPWWTRQPSEALPTSRCKPLRPFNPLLQVETSA